MADQADHAAVTPIAHNEVETTDLRQTLLNEGGASEEDAGETGPEDLGNRRDSDLSNSQVNSEEGRESGFEDQPVDQSKLDQDLLDAAMNKDEPKVMKLLAQGAGLSAVDRGGRTALSFIAESGFMAAIRAIVSKCPESVNWQDDDGSTLLHKAVRRNQLDMVEFLLDKNANIDFENHLGITALNVAVQSRKADVLKLMLDKTKVDHRDAFGHTALNQAILNRDADILELLLEKTKVDSLDSFGFTELHQAIVLGYADILELLLKKHADPFFQHQFGYTALQLAGPGYPWFTRERGENLIPILSKVMNLQDRREELMRIASLEKKKENLDFFLENLDWTGSELEKEKLPFEKSVNLLWAVCRGARDEAAYEIMKDMTAKSCAIAGVEDSKDWTALEWAACSGDHVVVWWLLVNRSREEIDIHRRRALDLAERQKQTPKDDQADYLLTIDILKDPPLVQGWSEPHEPYRYPELPTGIRELPEDFVGPSKTLLRGFEGSIVDFYRHTKGTRVDFLRRTRTIWDIIYENPKTLSPTDPQDGHSTSGPAMIMQEARAKLKDVGLKSQVAKQEIYSEEDLQLRWVHLPANNMEWMMDLAMRVYMDKKKTKEQFRPLREFMNHSWHELPGSRSELNYMSATCAKEQMPLDNKAGKQDPKMPEMVLREPRQTLDQTKATRIPYLTFSKYSKPGSEPTEQSKKVDELLKAYQTQNRNGSKDNRESSSKNKWRILHSSRTLDQFYYHSLANTDRRDSSQVVTRYAGCEPEDKEWDILRVDQLWLWVIDEKTIITSSTSRLDNQEDPILEGIFESLRNAKGKNKGQPPPSSVDEMCKYITNYCIELFDKPTLSCKGKKYDRLSVRQIFSNSINDATDGEMQLFMKFKHKIDSKLENLSKSSQDTQNKSADDHTKQQVYRDTTPEDPSSKPEDQEKDYKSISEATDLLLEVKDIRDELNILKYLLEQQKVVWEKLLETPNDINESVEGSGLQRHKETERWRGPSLAISSILEMDKLTQRIQDSVNSVIGLEQNEANLSEAESAREQTQVTIHQGKTIMVFTIITIVFLPMSFLTSLFALNVKSFPREKEIVIYSPGFIFSIIFGVTAAISIPTIIFAFFKNIRDLLGVIVTVSNNMLGAHSSNYFFKTTLEIFKSDPKKDSTREDGTAGPERQPTCGSADPNISPSSQTNDLQSEEGTTGQVNQSERGFLARARKFIGTRKRTLDTESLGRIE